MMNLTDLTRVPNAVAGAGDYPMRTTDVAKQMRDRETKARSRSNGEVDVQKRKWQDALVSRPRIFFITSYFLFYLAVFSLPLSAISGIGTTGAEFLRLGFDARSVGMGGTSTALPMGIGSLTGNLAGLSFMKTGEALLTHYQGLEGIQYDYAGFGGTFQTGSIAVGVKYARTGSLEGRDVSGQLTNTFDSDSFAVEIGYATVLAPGWRLGVGVMGLQERIEHVKAASVAGHFGLQGDLGGFTIGLALRNVGTPLQYDAVAAPLPTLFSMGVSVPITFNSQVFTLAWDGLVSPDEPFTMKGGMEWGFTDLLKVRGGLSAGGPGNAFGMFVGGGLKISHYSLDYAYVPFADLGVTHRFTLTTQF